MPRRTTRVDEFEIARTHRPAPEPVWRSGSVIVPSDRMRVEPMNLRSTRQDMDPQPLAVGARNRRARVQQAERIRARIAADLHDDIGSALSRLSILAEVIKRQIAASGGEPLPLLDDMADTARGMLDGMSDIVWSIDPRRDDLGSVVARVRCFAAGLLDSQGIQWALETDAHPEEVKLDPRQRRHVLLICKEALTNIVRHSRCRTVTIALTVAAQCLMCEITDDGRGLQIQNESLNATSAGRGLQNFQARAAELGGSCRLESGPGGGTRLHVRIPLRRAQHDRGGARRR